MAMNIKFEDADAVAVCSAVLSKPAGERDGITGFWRADLARVKNEHVIRLADMSRRCFLLEAEIDSEDTHRMDPKRREEYIDHEIVKKQIRLERLSPDERRTARDKIWNNNLQPCVDGKPLPRVVIAFRNARPLSGEIDHLGKSPIWYTKD